jgi:hypothetical protein
MAVQLPVDDPLLRSAMHIRSSLVVYANSALVHQDRLHALTRPGRVPAFYDNERITASATDLRVALAESRVALQAINHVIAARVAQKERGPADRLARAAIARSSNAVGQTAGPAARPATPPAAQAPARVPGRRPPHQPPRPTARSRSPAVKTRLRHRATAVALTTTAVLGLSAVPAFAASTTRGVSGCFAYSYSPGWMTTTVYFHNRCTTRHKLDIQWYGNQYKDAIKSVPANGKGSVWSFSSGVDAVWDEGRT